MSTEKAEQTQKVGTTTTFDHTPEDTSEPQASEPVLSASELPNQDITTLAIDPVEETSDPEVPDLLPTASTDTTTLAFQIVEGLSDPQVPMSFSSALVPIDPSITTLLEVATGVFEAPSTVQVLESSASAPVPRDPRSTTQSQIATNQMPARNNDISGEVDKDDTFWIVHPPTFTSELSVEERPWSSAFLRSDLLSPRSTSERGIQLQLQRSPPPSVVTEDQVEDILPHTITANVKISWMGKKDWSRERSFHGFAWTCQPCYGQLLPTQIKEKSQETYKDLKGKRIYHRYGTCRVVPTPQVPVEIPHKLLDDFELSTLVDNAIPLISGFINKHPRREFHLEVYWEYGYASLDPKPSLGEVGSPTFNEMIGLELDSLQQENFNRQNYISRRDQSAFQEYDVVKNLVFYDSSLSHLDEREKQGFVKLIIQRPALKLLLNCVSQKYSMYFLRHMLVDHKMNDEPYRNDIQDCEFDYCKQRLTNIQKKQSMFLVENINQGDEYRKLESSVIMPLHHTGVDLETSQNETKSLKPYSLGEGASSKVHRVRIDSAHHYLSGDPSCCFALKTFPSTRIKEFNREKKMLQVLARHPNADIVPYITSWSQNEEHFILYPEARYNLRQYMLQVKPVKFSKHGIRWFLRQLKGLARAIDHVHNFKGHKFSDEDDDMWGCHFDIKPENILVFEQVPGYHSMFKIADFGVGVFNKGNKNGVHSVLTSEARGTLTYFAPDKEMNDAVSRPFDMWALGCVYLELMLWQFRFFEGRTGTFSTERFECTGVLPKSMTDKFWHNGSTAEKPEYKLLPIVKDVIAELRNDCCVDMPAFLDILVAVDGLLQIQANDRWTAEKLKIHMEKVVRKAKTDLESSDQYYSSRYAANMKRAKLMSFRALTANEPALDSTAGLRANNKTLSQETAVSEQQAQRCQSDRAAESVVGAGTGQMRSSSNGSQHASDNGQPSTSGTRIDSGDDPLEQDLNEMADPSITSSTQPPEITTAG